LLTDSAFIVRGGKSGNLFETGKPDMSLLLQRIHLPLEEKKHMPPAGKPQLTNEEMELLYYWIKLGPVFNKKLIDLPYTDSLRMVAASALLQEGGEGELFDFPPAEDGLISKLNNNYRLIMPIAKESPALAATLFNRNAYSSKSLEELLAVKTQVISLDLNKLPVKDEDFKTIAQFSNLRKLNLNFSDITGAGLSYLSSLQHLRNLSVAGTRVDAASLKKMASLKEMSTLVVWNTGLSDKEIQQLKTVNSVMNLEVGYRNDGTDSVQLNLPVFKNDRNPVSTIFIDKSVVLHLTHPVKGVDIRYNSQKDPDSSNSNSFSRDTILLQNTVIRAKAFKQGWVGSDIAKFQFYKSSVQADSVHLLTKPDESHTGVGAATFTNKLAGDFNFYTDKWIGFRQQPLQVMYEFKQPVEVSSVGLHVMVMSRAEVFPPSSIEVWGGEKMDNLKLMGMIKPSQPGKKDKDSLVLLESNLKPAKVSYLKIVAKPIPKFPYWVKTKDKFPWILVDEIMLN
jgi:hypothetical protein